MDMTVLPPPQLVLNTGHSFTEKKLALPSFEGKKPEPGTPAPKVPAKPKMVNMHYFRSEISKKNMFLDHFGMVYMVFEQK